LLWLPGFLKLLDLLRALRLRRVWGAGRRCRVQSSHTPVSLMRWTPRDFVNGFTS